MSYADFLVECQALASSVGEFASLLVLAGVSYLVAVVRSLAKRVREMNPTKSAFASAPARRVSRARRVNPSSSALLTASAANQQPSPSGVNEDGIQEIPPLTQVERFVSSIPQEELFGRNVAPLGPLVGSSSDGANPASRTIGGAERGPDYAGADAAGSGSPTGNVLGAKTG